MRYFDREASALAERNGVTRSAAWNCSSATINGISGSLLCEAALLVLALSLGPPLLLGDCLEVDALTLRTSCTRFRARRAAEGQCFCHRPR
jgi:hypothetical protein